MTRSLLFIILTYITSIVIIGMLLFLYVQSHRGNQRAINTTSNLLLPILSAIAVTLGILYGDGKAFPVCTGGFALFTNIGIGIVALLLVLGFARYFIVRNRDRRLITQPVLLATMLIIVIFLIDFSQRCL